jgi:hypothetical protein
LWSWNKARLRGAKLRQGDYLLRTNLDPMDPDVFWRQYLQLTEVEAAFRALKSELAIRPIWHHIQRRVEAHILVAFLAYCLWVCLKQKLKVVAESITPARALESLRSILMAEVWFKLRDGGQLCLPRITEAEKEQALLLHHLAWQLPAQPPPRIYRHQVPQPCSANQAASRAHFVYDRWLIRRLPKMLTSEGFEVKSFRSHGYTQTTEPTYRLRSWTAVQICLPRLAALASRRPGR